MVAFGWILLFYISSGLCDDTTPPTYQIILRNFTPSAPPPDGQPTVIKVGVVLSRNASSSDSMHKAANILPALYVAFRDALPRYNIKYEVKLELYDDCRRAAYDGVNVPLPFETFNKTVSLLLDQGIAGNLIVAPACTEDMLQSTLLTSAYPTNVATGGGELIDTTAQYAYLNRCSYNTFSQWSSLMLFAAQQNWSRFAVFYDSDDATLKTNALSLISNLQIASTIPNTYEVHYPLYSHTNITAAFLSASKSARIFVLLVRGDRLRNLMLNASNLKMTNGEYAFFTLDVFATDVLAHNGWKRGDTFDNQAKQAYQSVMVITLHDKTQSAAYKYLDQEAKKMLDAMPELTEFRNDYDGLNYFASAYYDCILYCAFQYNLSLGDGITDLTAEETMANVSTYLWGQSVFYGGASGDMFIMITGDRDDDFSIHAMTDPDAGTYSVIGSYWGYLSNFTQTADIPWPGGKAPLNEPVCGYTGTNCTTGGTSDVMEISFGIGIPIVFMLAYAAHRLRKHAVVQKRQDEMWIARWSELKIRSKDKEKDKEKKMLAAMTAKKEEEHIPGASMGASMGMTLFAGMGKHDRCLGESMGNARVTASAFWKNHPITVRWSKKQVLRMNNTILRQVRQMFKLEHDNLLPFLGACIERDHVLMIYEFCNKGTLHKALDNPNVKLEWTVRFSFLSDCTKGLAYLHNSSLRVHGRLTSMCCYIDSGFMLRIADYGLPAFYELTVAELWEARRDPEYRLAQVWKAPEHLVKEASSQIEVINSMSQPGDVYSFGVIAQEIITRRRPFAREDTPDPEAGAIIEAVKASTVKGNAPFIPYIEPDACSPELRDLCLKCYTMDPAKRPTAQDLRKALREQGKLIGMTEHSNVLDTLLLQMEAQSARLQAIVEEKNHELLDEKLRSDTLLYKILPMDIAETLKKGTRPNAENVELITVAYIDILGFNTMASESTPLQVLEFLNDLYAFFDENISKFDAYKIENRNDVTQIVSGLPLRNGILHAREIGRLALTILFKINSFKIKHRPDDQMKLRIGIHSGPVVAAVIGRKLPRYSLFGATVDICLRMLTSGEALKIQLSSMTKNILETFGSFRLVERGEIFVKGKGAMKTYWLMGEDGNMELLELQKKFEEEDIEEDLGEPG
ncbi:atrial natriuretic peptide receptor 1-like [Paramacrobiotus metropolitanus]|uniref:atrial natriuretic peptide receptor 1-like n=1 Tax=Paramacrobiotus metropolitanus TaxID=2943436 RepID=UPI002445B16E|nr:atrial natriuretic peptide receptor 1-like [Paramacrobiotus metropolitanus]